VLFVLAMRLLFRRLFYVDTITDNDFENGNYDKIVGRGALTIVATIGTRVPVSVFTSSKTTCDQNREHLRADIPREMSHGKRQDNASKGGKARKKRKGDANGTALRAGQTRAFSGVGETRTVESETWGEAGGGKGSERG